MSQFIPLPQDFGFRAPAAETLRHQSCNRESLRQNNGDSRAY